MAAAVGRGMATAADLGTATAIDLGTAIVDHPVEVEAVGCTRSATEDMVTCRRTGVESRQESREARKAAGQRQQDRAAERLGFPAAWETDIGCY